jgi:FkbM family methyltransferase
MKQLIRQTVKAALHKVGLDLVRVRPDEKTKLLGLVALGVRSVIDVGANVGQFAALAASAFPGARIYSFEPLPSAFPLLSAFAAEKGKGRIRAFNVALGEREGTVPMRAKADWNLSSSLLKSTEAMHERWPNTREESVIDVALTTLDAFVAREALELPDLLIKLDVQGYEAQVLRGGLATLKRARAVILEVNIDPLYDGQASFQELFRILDEIGYRYVGNFEQSVAADGHVIYLDAVFLNTAAAG